ncbi:hypothetical protein HZB00_04055 [Candidatus Woesearchaeota archaeon]|nr:hypothetical protein [Candidatus Woesearchaeota archaeon]
MALAGFHFSKFTVERLKVFQPSDQISTDVKVTDIVSEDIGNNELLVKFIFEFSTKYGSAGNALLAGQVLYVEPTDKGKQIVESWQKEKKTDADLLQQVLNTILFRCNIKCLELANEVGLPPHFDLPRFQFNKPEEKPKK